MTKNLRACLRPARVARAFQRRILACLTAGRRLLVGTMSAWVALAAMVGYLPLATAAGASYVYDEIGRLVQVIAPDGTSTQYAYDPVGNITAVRADGVASLAITGFYPEVGPVGSTITITGSGFSTTASNNTVKFNGVAATVSTATATQLTVTVPTGATSGAISVANTNGAVTSTRAFTVGTGSAPSITGFSPTLGNPGAVVTITGQNFQASPLANHVAFNTSLASPVSAASAGSLSTAVPSSGGSGKIVVSTAYGSATSTADFLAVPSNLTPASIQSWTRGLVGGAAQKLSVSTAGNAAALLFDGTANELVTVSISGSTVSPSGSVVAYEVYGPQGTRVASGSVSTIQPNASLPALAVGGTYAVFFEPAPATASLSVTLKADAAFAADGGRYQIQGLFGGSSASVTFKGTAGQNLGLGLNGLAFAGSTVVTAPLTMQVLTPAGTVWLSNANCAASNPGGGCDLNLTNLPATGTYTVKVSNPAGNGPIASGFLTLSSDRASALTAGTAHSYYLRNGQNGRLSFAGTAGQAATLWVEDQFTVPAGVNVPVTIFNPDGSTLATTTLSATAAGVYINVPGLPATGNYTIFVDPAYGAEGAMQATFNPGAASVAVDGAGVSTSTANGRYLTFAGAAGQNLDVGVSGLAFVGGGPGTVTLQVLQPTGAVLQSLPCASGAAAGCELSLTNLPSTGTYKIQFTTSPAIVASGTLTLSSVKAASLTSGSVYALSLRSGQNAMLTFTGTAGQPATIRFESIATTPANQTVSLTLLKPDGSSLGTTSGSTSGNGGLIFVSSLPSTGTYTVSVTVASGASASMKIKLNGAPDLVVDGAAVNITSTATGYGTSLSFNGTAGQNLGVALSGLTLSGGAGGALGMTIIRPDGSSWWQSAYCSTGNPGAACSAALPLTQTGTYLLQITSGGAPAITGGTVTMSSDKAATLTPGSPYALSLRWGQNSRLTFSGVAGQPATVRFANMTTNPVNTGVSLTILDANGNPVSFTARGSSSTNGGAAFVGSLPSTGTYQVVMVPDYGAQTTATVTLDPAPELVVDGPPVNITSPAAGYGTSLTFTGTAGQNLGVAINGIAFGGASAAAGMNIIRPDGSSWWQSAYCSTGNPGAACSAALPLTQTGTYLLQVTNGSPAITGGTVTMSSDKAAALTPGSPYALSLRWGQNGRLTFTGTTATHSLDVGVPTTAPAGLSVAVTVVDASGSTVASGSYSTAGGTLTLGTLAAATYTVLVVPSYGAPTTVSLTYH